MWESDLLFGPSVCYQVNGVSQHLVEVMYKEPDSAV